MHQSPKPSVKSLFKLVKAHWKINLALVVGILGAGVVSPSHTQTPDNNINNIAIPKSTPDQCFEDYKNGYQTLRLTQTDIQCLKEIKTLRSEGSETFKPYYDNGKRVVRHAGTATTYYRLPKPRWRRSNFDEEIFAESLNTFSSVEDCIDVRQDGTLDFAAIRFSEIGSHEDAFACYQWAALSLDSVYDVFLWITETHAGSSVSISKSKGSYQFTVKGNDKRRYSLPGIIEPLLLEFLFGKRFQIGLVFGSEDGLINLSISSDSLN